MEKAFLGAHSSLPCRLTCPVLTVTARLVSGSASPVVIAVPTDGPWTSLTVDDGPHPATTPALLEVLARHGARATFFLIGERAVAHPSLVADIVDAGHELGNHLWSDRPSVRLPAATFRDELARTGEQLARHSRVSWWRPGSGMFTRAMVREAEAQGHRGALGSPWLVATRYGDDNRRRGERLAGRAHVGAIAVFHEGTPERSAVAKLTDGYLHRLAQRGLGATTLTDLTRR
jgi:peptidoglycan/xylan/chitin deacetylase (PgdA/CDA1 family)